MKRILDIAAAAAGGACLLWVVWEWAVAHWQVPVYVLPAPVGHRQGLARQFLLADGVAGIDLDRDPGSLCRCLVLGVATAIAFSQSRLLERTLYPYAVILQVTPVVAIAPLILIWVGFERINLALVHYRHHRRLLSHPVRRHAGLEIGGFQSGRPDAALWRVALADLVARPAAHGPALSAVGHEDGGRPGPDRRGGGRIRRRLRHRHRAGLAHRGVRQPAWRSPPCSPPWRCWRSPALLIFAALSLLEWLLLRRWHESAIRPRRLDRRRLAQRQHGESTPSASAPHMYQAGASGDPVLCRQPGDHQVRRSRRRWRWRRHR